MCAMGPGQVIKKKSRRFLITPLPFEISKKHILLLDISKEISGESQKRASCAYR